jgi:teichuronic acid biosynthesis glycosyltransferase TuaC
MGSSNRLSVLIVTNMYPTPDAPAYGSFVRDQARALQAIGTVDVDVFAFDARGRPWRYVGAAAALRRRCRPHDVVHAHYGLTGAACLALPRTTPLVLTVHGRDCHHPVVRRLTALAARRAQATIAVSRELASLCPFPVTDVVPPGVDLALFAPLPQAEARRRLGLDSDEQFVLFPADPTRPEKRHERAAVVAALTPVRLRELTGVPRQEVPLWLNAADAVLVTSEREGYGLACVEALACDVPVLSMPVGIAPEVLAGIDGCLCAPFDAHRWSAHLRDLLAQANARVAGREVAAREGVSAVAERLVTIYERANARAARR